MRIGIDGRLWNETGVGRYIRNLVVHLQEEDPKNDYLLFIKPQDEKAVKSALTNKRFQYSNVDIHWHTLREQMLFGGFLDKQVLDLMHFPYFSLPISYRKPFVVTIHDLIIHQFATGNASTLPLPMYAVKRFGFKRVFNHALRRSEKIIVPLETVKAEVEERFGVERDKVIVTTEGFDHRIKKSVTPSERIKKEVEKGKYFLYVGNAYPHKNVGFLLAAFHEFIRTHPGHRLILVIKEDFFQEQLQSVTSSESVSFLSDISDSDLGYLYVWAEAFVSSSLMEGFGLPALEAMAVHTPVLLSDIPSFREVCRDAGIYFDPTVKNSLIAGFEKITKRTALQKSEYKEKALERVAEFSWTETARRTRAVYESCFSV